MMPIPDPRYKLGISGVVLQLSWKTNFQPSLFRLDGFQFLSCRVVSCLFSSIKIFNPFSSPTQHLPKYLLNIPVECFLHIKFILFFVKLIRNLNFSHFLLYFLKLQ
ncbi:hypothetical protein HanRHA438_Chr12g0533751 [Helianthus annuus]|nr:hypothetical protein HanRHA438_Chr12g0533751 [Helianthus annuus]